MVFLIPEKRGGKGGMADVIASLDGVQGWLDDFAFEAKVRAEEELASIRSGPDYTGSGQSSIDVEAGVIDRHLILEHSAGDKAAAIVAVGKLDVLGKAIKRASR